MGLVPVLEAGLVPELENFDLEACGVVSRGSSFAGRAGHSAQFSRTRAAFEALKDQERLVVLRLPDNRLATVA